MVEARAEQVEREDVVNFLSAALVGTGQAEFYDTADEQTFTLDFLHEYMRVAYRRLYARTLALVRPTGGLNHHNALRVVQSLLAAGAPADPEQRAEENGLIRAALRHLPPHRVLRMFAGLRRAGVNNRRARATVRAWLASRRDPVFDMVKYRARYRTVVLHAHLPLNAEAATFLYGRWIRFRTPLFEAVRQARYSQAKVYELPFTIAEGLAAAHGIRREVFLERIQAQMTVHERQRLQRSAAGHEVDLGVDLTWTPLTSLALFVLSLPPAERLARRAELDAALDAAARRVPTDGLVGPVTAVLDNSWSSSGSSEKRRRPLALALALDRVVRLAGGSVVWTSHVDDPLLVTPRGSTRLAEPLIDALEGGAATVLLLSDGAENDPPGAVAEVMRHVRARLDPQGRTRVVHLNPALSARTLFPLTLSPHIATVGIRDVEDLPLCLALAAFSEGRPRDELERYLDGRVADALVSLHPEAS
jgi:hypothetical protein